MDCLGSERKRNHSRPSGPGRSRLHGQSAAVRDFLYKATTHRVPRDGRWFGENVLARKGLDPVKPAGYEKTRDFILDNLARVTREQITFAERFEDARRQSDR